MNRYRPTSIALTALCLALIACAGGAAPTAGGDSGVVTGVVTPESSVETQPAAASETPTIAAPHLDIAQVGKALDATAPSILKEDNIAGCSITVVYDDAAKGGLQAAFFNYGTLSAQSKTAVDENTVYEIGSLSKLFAADVLALNVGQGTMSLDDPLQKYLPESVHVPDYEGQPITLLTLATHTSGLPRNVGDSIAGTIVNGTNGNWTDDEFFKFLNGYTLTSAPGSKNEYSNLAFALLGIAEERLGQDTFEHLVSKGITGPLGMPDTLATLSAEQKARLAVSIGKGGKKAPTFSDTSEMISAGGLRSTARDLATYLIANIEPPDGPVGAAITLTEQPQNVAKTNTGGTMGLAWQISGAGTPNEGYSKNGATAGFNAQITFSKAKRKGYAVACNGHPMLKLVPELNKLIFQGQMVVDDSQE